MLKTTITGGLEFFEINIFVGNMAEPQDMVEINILLQSKCNLILLFF
jgi:hypothetical protein